MPLTSQRSRHRRRSQPRRGRAILAALLATLTLLGAFIAVKALRQPGEGSAPAPVAEQSQDHQWALEALAREDFNIATPEFASDRPVYRYSVVPGGTHNPDELRDAITRDAVVAAHYESVDQSRLRTEVVPSDRYVHVSYRKGDRVFFTNRKVLLRKGETILTDGTTQIRTRCGNCISEQAAGPTSPEEPDVVEFDRLVDPLPRTGAPEVALVPAAQPQPQGLAPGLSAGASAPIAGFGSTPQGGAPLAAGNPVGGGGGTPDPLVAARPAATRDPGPTGPDTPDNGPAPPVDNDPPGPGIDLPDLPDLPNPPGEDEPFPPLNPFPPGPDNPFPPGPDDPPPGPENPLPPADDPPGPGPENPTPVPEPGTLLLVGGGAAEIIRRLRRRSFERKP